MIRTILLVEDDRVTALLVKTLLQKEYYKVLLAGNGVEALNVLSKEKIDLVVTDVVMPIMDGVDLYDQIKKNEKTKHLPVIIVTDKQMFKEAFAALGVDHFVAKTDDITVLLERIKTINTELQKPEYRKILVSGGNRLAIDQIRKLLATKNYLVTVAEHSFDAIQKVFMMAPHIILLDLRMNDQAEAQEIIKGIRSFKYFRSVKILTYTYFTTEEMENADMYLQIIQNESKVCEELGAKFIGNFSQVAFLQNFQEHTQDQVQESLV